MNSLAQSVAIVADPWKQGTYYNDAEQWTFIFWSDDHPFHPLFKRLDLTAVLELACGHGRHSEIVAERSGQFILMDVHEENIDYCRRRLAQFQNIVFFANNGTTFDLSQTTISPRSSAMTQWCISALTFSRLICAIRHGC